MRPAEWQDVEITLAASVGGRYRLVIYNTAGEVVKLVMDKTVGSSTLFKVTWDGRNDFGEPVASGVYLIHAETPGFAKIRRVAVLR